MAAHISPSTIAGLSIGNSNGLFHRPHRPPRRPLDAFPRVPALASVRSPCAAEPGDGSRRGLGCGEGDAEDQEPLLAPRSALVFGGRCALVLAQEAVDGSLVNKVAGIWGSAWRGSR